MWPRTAARRADSAVDVGRWLEEHQPEPALTELQQELLDYLHKTKVEEWRDDLGMTDG